MRILVVEDDETIAEPLCAGLAREGFDVRHASTGEAALAAEPADLVLLDLGLPDLDGRVVCRTLRDRSNVPIIVVSARGDEIDRVLLLELGADDYVVKPFGFRELVARMRAVLRRTGSDSAAPLETIDVGDLHIDRRSRAVAVDGRQLTLTPKEFDLLVHLAADHGAVSTREQIMANVWDENWWGSTKTLDVHIASLRKKLGGDWIETVRGVGFVLHDPGHVVTRRLLLGYLTVTVFVLILLEVPLAVFFEQRETERLTADLDRDAAVLATIYEDSLEAGTPADPNPAERYSNETGARVVVVDTDGIAVVDTDDVTGRDFSTRPEFVTALTGRRDTGTRFSTTLDTELLFVAVPVASGGVVHGALRVTFDAREVTERVRRFWLGLGAVAVVVLAAVTAVGWAVARSVTRPIRGLQQTATRFARGDLSIAEPEPGAPAELRDLERAMNTMAQRLDELLREQRAFVADASHQLRTPLTALRLRLENLQMQVDGASDAHELDAAVAEIDRLTELVHSLLVLARAEQAPAPACQDLAALVRDRVDTWSAIAEADGVTLRAEAADQTCIVSAVPGGLEQVLDNLIDNAVAAITGVPSDRRTEAGGGSVVVAIVRDRSQGAGHEIVLEVADTGPGLDDTEKEMALGRFWRGDPGRPGTGLGLAIVDQIVRASGGRVELVDNRPNGLSVRVHLRSEPSDTRR